jgi:dienelactone hydrolase
MISRKTRTAVGLGGRWIGGGLLGLGLAVGTGSIGQGATSPGDWLARYFESETTRIERSCLDDARAVEHFRADREGYRRQLLEMLGLWPMPERTELKAEVTGRIEHPEFTVEKLYFQSMPRLYVTANLYVPKGLSAPAPAILYVCGHAAVRTNNVSCGNKTAYQHHGIWFARHGYVCLTIDTVQLGEIEGLHHGTYREGMWWWNSRGYTPAGVEAWNSLRALDYLETRPEVDAQRIGMTGRSGGGTYSWTTAALDERVKAVAPVAGITDLRNHVVDGCVAGHCDCMFMVNQHRWDYPMQAALVAPRPLLIVNTDADGIFPLDGVIRTHAKVRQVYEAYGAASNLGLVIAPGPHRDTQDLQVPVFRWFNRHLKGDDPPIETAAVRLFDPWDLRVFEELPADAINARIHETFVPTQSQTEPADMRARLREASFAGWPDHQPPPRLRVLDDRQRSGLRLQVLEYESQPEVRLRLFVVEPEDGDVVRETVLDVLDQEEWLVWRAGVGRIFGEGAGDGRGAATALAPSVDAPGAYPALLAQLEKQGRRSVVMPPRGVGPSAWEATEREEIQIRRRFMLLGQTLEGMRVWDIWQATRAWRAWEGREATRLMVTGRGTMGVNVLYAGLFSGEMDELRLSELPDSHRVGPDYLNVLKITDIPQTLTMVRERLEERVDDVTVGLSRLH